MAEQPIKYSDIISPDVQRQLDELSTTVKSLTKELEKLSKETTDQDKAAENYADTLRDEVEISEDLLRLTRDEIRLKDEVTKAKKKHKEATEAEVVGADKYAVAAKKGQETLRKHSFEVKNATKLALAQKGSMTELSLELGKNRMKYRELSQAQRENAKIGGTLLKKIKSQDAAIKKLDKSIGNTQRNVGNYTSALSGMGGMLGTVGMQLQSTLTSLTAVKTALVASTAASSGTAKAMKILRLALISTGIGAIVVVLGTLITYLTQTASGTSKLAKAMAPLKAILSTITSLAKSFGEGLALMLDGDFAGGFDLMTKSVKGLGEEYKRHAAIQATISQLEEQLHIQRRDSILVIQQMETEQRRLLAVSKDSTVSLKDRMAAQIEAIQIEKNIAAQRQSISALEIAILTQQSNLSEDSREEEIALQEARASHSAIIEQQNKRMATYNAQLETLINKSNRATKGTLDFAGAMTELSTRTAEGIDITNASTGTLEKRTFITEQAAEADKATTSQIIGGVQATSAAMFSAAEDNKDTQTAQALINTFAAVGIALATPGNIYTNLITAAVALATGIANVANIQNSPAYAGGTEFLTGDNSGPDKININADYGERIVPSYLNEQMQGVPNIELPALVTKGKMYDNGVIQLLQQQVSATIDNGRTMKKFAYVDKNGSIHYLNGNIKNYV